jgi:hypothetical protein
VPAVVAAAGDGDAPFLVRAVPVGSESSLPDGISIMAPVALGNWRIAGMGNVFLIGLAIGVANPHRGGRIVIQL